MELDGEFVKQYKDDKNFHKEATGRSVYMKMNQGKDGVKTDLANLNLRRGLAMAIDKTGMVNTLLANGSKALNGDVPGDIMFDPETKEDFRKQNGDLLKFDQQEATNAWKQGLKEIGKSELTLTLTSGDTSLQRKQTEFIQNQLEENLPGLTIKLKMLRIKLVSKLTLHKNLNYYLEVGEEIIKIP